MKVSSTRSISERRLLLFFLILIVLIFAGGGCINDNDSDNTGSAGELEVRSVDHTFSRSAEEIPREDFEKVTTSTDEETGKQTLVFPSSTDAYDTIQTGDVIVAGVSSTTPEGMLKKVVGTEKRDGKLVVEVESATLPDAYDQLSFNFKKQLTAQEIRSVSTTRGVTPNPSRARAAEAEAGLTLNPKINKILYDKDGNKKTTSDQVKLTGQLHMSVGFEFIFDFSAIPTPTLNKFEFKPIIDERSGLEVSSGIGYKLKKKFRLATYHFAPFAVGPVVFTPQMVLYATADGEVCAEMKSGVTQDFNYTYTIAYEDSEWTSYGEKDSEFEFIEPQLTGYVKTEAGIKPQCILKLYGVAGPYVGAKGILGFKAQASTSTSELCWDLYTGIDASGGVKIGIFGRILWASAEIEFFSFEKSLKKACFYLNNLPPTADAGSDQTVSEQKIVTLDGSGSTDPDDGINTYQWEQTGGEHTVNLDNASVSQPSFLAPEVDADGDTLEFRLTVEDYGGSADSDTCNIMITDRGSGSVNLIVYAQEGKTYEIWGGNELHDDIAYYNVQDLGGYTQLYTGEGVSEEITEEYRYYVVGSTEKSFYIDAINFCGGYINREMRLDENIYFSWGNLTPETEPNLDGGPDGEYAELGDIEGTSGGLYPGFLIFENSCY